MRVPSDSFGGAEGKRKRVLDWKTRRLASLTREIALIVDPIGRFLDRSDHLVWPSLNKRLLCWHY